MGHRVLRGCAFVGVAFLASVVCGQDPAVTVPGPGAPAAAAGAPAVEGGGNIFADITEGPADQVLDMVAKQAGVELVVNNDSIWGNAEPVTLKVLGGHFWPVFFDLCKQANIRFQPEYGGQGSTKLRLYEARQMPADFFDRLPRSVHQGFVVMPQSASRSYNIFYAQANPPSGGVFQIQMMVYVDPSTPVTGWAATATEAVDENGTSLLPKDDRGGVNYGSSGNPLVQNIGVTLANPVNIGKTLVSLKGAARGMAVVKTEKLDVDLPLPPEGKTIKTSEGEIVIASVKPGGQSKAYNLIVRFVTTPSEDGRPRGGLRRQSQDRWNLVSTIRIADAQGKTFAYGGGGGGGDDGRGIITYTVNFSAGQDTGEPAKLTWRLPVETKQIQIPFEFKNLAIP